MVERGHGLLDVGKEEELQRLVDRQTALRRVATLVATGVTDLDLVAAVTSEIAQLFAADREMRRVGTATRSARSVTGLRTACRLRSPTASTPSTAKR